MTYNSTAAYDLDSRARHASTSSSSLQFIRFFPVYRFRDTLSEQRSDFARGAAEAYLDDRAIIRSFKIKKKKPSVENAKDERRVRKEEDKRQREVTVGGREKKKKSGRSPCFCVDLFLASVAALVKKTGRNEEREGIFCRFSLSRVLPSCVESSTEFAYSTENVIKR